MHSGVFFFVVKLVLPDPLVNTGKYSGAVLQCSGGWGEVVYHVSTAYCRRAERPAMPRGQLLPSLESLEHRAGRITRNAWPAALDFRSGREPTRPPASVAALAPAARWATEPADGWWAWWLGSGRRRAHRRLVVVYWYVIRGPASAGGRVTLWMRRLLLDSDVTVPGD